MPRARTTRVVGAAALLVSAVLAAGAPTAGAAYIPGVYTIQATKPTSPPPRDHRTLYVTAVSASTSEPVRLAPRSYDAVQRQRAEFQLDQQSTEFAGKTYTAYVLVNRYYRGCLTWIRPLVGNGTRVGLAAYPSGCTSWPQKWVLNNGSRWVTISDPHGNDVGFQLNIPVRVGLVMCLDVTGFNHAAANHLQEWRCTGAWNQRFLVRRVPGS
jgi:hypothetical protein